MNSLNHVLQFFLAVLLCASMAHALVFLVKPVSQPLESGATVLLGSIMPGETLELVFSNDDREGGFWNRLQIAQDSLPSGWVVSAPQLFAESLVVSVRVPGNETEHLQNIHVRLLDVHNPLHAQDVSLQVLVKNDLVKASFSPLQDSVLLGQKARYKLVLVNNSLADHLVTVRSSLPFFWFEPIQIKLSAKPDALAQQELVLGVNTKSYGVRNFSFLVDSDLSGRHLAVYQTDLLVRPTLQGKFQSGLFGFSFFTPNLSVFYFFNGLLGSLQ